MAATRWPVASVEGLIASYRESGDERLRTAIIERHTNLVRSLAYKFVRSGVSADDLAQCG